jgi:hypothetical protein
MRKLRDDSTWNQLSPDQRELLEEWLFDENLGYAETLARVQKEFGLNATMASLGRYYRRRAGERQVGELLDAQIAANELNDLPINTGELRSALIKLIGKAAFKLVNEKPEHLSELVSVTQLLLDSEEIEIRRGRLKLAQQYFDYEATAASIKELPQMRSYLSVISKDTSLSHEQKMERVRAILFGWDKTGAEEGDKS